MGSICSKGSYEKMSGKKGNKKKKEHPADLDKTMRDDVHPKKELQHSYKNSNDVAEPHTPTTKNKKAQFSSENGVGLTSETLDNEYLLSEIVKLPPNVTEEEWVYTNLIGFVKEITLLYDSIADECTSSTCPEMTAGPHYTYLWTDSRGSDPISMSANEYINTLFQYISDLFKRAPYNECENGIFPDDFMKTVSNIFKRLFRVYAHVYHHHLNSFVRTGAEAHLNTTFKHFVLFEREFQLISCKEELPLRKLIKRLLQDETDDDSIPNVSSSSSYRNNHD